MSPLKEGGDRFTVGTLRACSYKAKAEGWHQGLYPHTLQGFLWFLFLSYNSFTRNSLSLLDKRDFWKSPKQAQRFSDSYTITPVGVCIKHKAINKKNISSETIIIAYSTKNSFYRSKTCSTAFPQTLLHAAREKIQVVTPRLSSQKKFLKKTYISYTRQRKRQ